MADDVTTQQTGAEVEPTPEKGTPADSGSANGHDTTALTSAKAGGATGTVDEDLMDSDVSDEDDDEDEDEEAVDEVQVIEEEVDETPMTGEEAGTVTLHLPTDLRRRLRRRAEREGVTAEELAGELLGAAIRRTAGESLTDVIARLDKLERTVAELGTARPRTEAAPAARRPEERPRGEYGSRPAAGAYGERRTPDRPSYPDRGGYAGPRRQDDRPRFGERPPATGFGRSDNRFSDRPRFDAPDRGPSRSFDRHNDRYDRDDSRERPPHRWESPRRGD